jgi:LytS/YehU family sensor histidine kinase
LKTLLAIFTNMKRLLNHGAFWLIYYIQFCFIEYFWATRQLHSFSKNKAFIAVLESSALYTMLEMAFCYFMVYGTLDRIVQQRKTRLHNIIEIIIVLGVMAVAERLLANYIILPYVYLNEIPTSALLRIDKLAIVIVYAGFALGLMISVKSIRDQFAAKKREQDLIRQKLDAELKYLKNQMNPHFLFNTLNNIYALARKKSDKTPEAILKLSELLSFMLYESGKDFIPVCEEVRIIEDYIGLQKLRYNDRLNISFNKQIDDATQGIAPLLLISLVENAFKHGASESRFNSFISIHLRLENGILHFIIGNSVESMEANDTNKAIGLANIRRQLELLYREHELNVCRSNAEFEVQLVINLNSHEKA